jgi:hypothetical protein
MDKINLNELIRQVNRASSAEIESAMRGRIRTYEIRPQAEDSTIDGRTFLIVRAGPTIERLLKERVTEWHSLKANLYLECTYQRTVAVSTEMELDYAIHHANFKTRSRTLIEGNNIAEHVAADIAKLLTEMEEFVAKGSGWTLKTVDRLEVRISKFKIF